MTNCLPCLAWVVFAAGYLVFKSQHEHIKRLNAEIAMLKAERDHLYGIVCRPMTERQEVDRVRFN
jgi:hypothetical protein